MALGNSSGGRCRHEQGDALGAYGAVRGSYLTRFLFTSSLQDIGYGACRDRTGRPSACQVERAGIEPATSGLQRRLTADLDATARDRSSGYAAPRYRTTPHATLEVDQQVDQNRRQTWLSSTPEVGPAPERFVKGKGGVLDGRSLPADDHTACDPISRLAPSRSSSLTLRDRLAFCASSAQRHTRTR